MANGIGGTCKSCKHYREPKSEERHGTCHEGPAQVTHLVVPLPQRVGPMQLGFQANSGWPTVPEDESCGRWAASFALQQ